MDAAGNAAGTGSTSAPVSASEGATAKGNASVNDKQFDAWVAQNVAADAEREMAEAAACTCPPGLDDDQCPVHERDIHMRERAREELRR